MQIHEITKLQQQLEEGILSGIKKAVSATKTGAVNAVKGAGNFGAALLEPQINFAKDAKQTAATGLKKGGVGGMFKALTSNSALATAQQARDKKSSEKTLAGLAKQGISPLNYYIKKAKADQNATQKRQALDSAFPEEFAVGPTAEPGKQLKVALPMGPGQTVPSYAVKTAAGWQTETGKAITNPKSVDFLNQQAENPNQTKEVPVPKPAAPKAQKTPAVSPPTTAAVKEAMVAPRAAPGALARRAASRNAPTASAPTAPAPTKKNIQTDFTKWVSSALPDSATAMKDPEVKQALDAQFKKVLAAKNDPKSATNAVDQYILLVQAGIAKARDTGTAGMSGDGASETPGSANAPTPSNVISKMQQKGIKDTGDPEINQDLKYLKVPLKESQVAITQDIVVKTKAGNYVKKASDQEWYDPKGVLIDANKYADYVARLDATQPAQLRYQADAEKGMTDTAFKSKLANKLKTKLSPPPEPPPPEATAADYELYRQQQNQIQNQLIDQTVNDLRNAEFFNTGQTHYLQQQLAQLMAKKY
jgi:hypothetical protein